MKIFAWISLSFIIAIIVALVVYLIVGAVLCHLVLSRKSLADRILRKDLDRRIKENKIDLCWWDKQKLNKVEIKSFDGLKLVGRFIDNNSDKTALIVHGFGGSYLEMQPYCQFFMQKNFNVLAVDNRAHGDSEGSCVGLGFFDRLDVVEWTKYINSKIPNSKILLFGVSMGGTAVLCASCEKDLKNVQVIISDCAFANANKQVEHILSNHKFVLKFFRKWLYSYAKKVYGIDIMQADATKQVKKTQIPILYIHGSEDNFVPTENLNILYDATPSNLRDKFIVEGAKHATSYAVGGVLYEHKINQFLQTRTNLNK